MSDVKVKDFITLSENLTDFSLQDHPTHFQMALDFYNFIISQDPSYFDELMGENLAVTADDMVTYKKRAIMLLWYLGYWYPPQELKALENGGAISPKVVSSSAYLKGLVWNVIKAQPMGYSDQPYGHWSKKPVR